MDPVTLGISAALAAAGAATSAAQASAQNRAIKRSAASARTASAVQSQQVADAANLERQKRINESEQIIGRLRVAGAAAGVDPSLGSFADLQRQAQIDAKINQQIINRNHASEQARVASGLQANLTDLSSRVQSPVLAMFQGGIGGAQAGLQIGGALGTPSTITDSQIAAIPSQFGLL